MKRCPDKVTDYTKALAIGEPSDNKFWAVNLGNLDFHREMQIDLLRAAKPLVQNMNKAEEKKKLLYYLDVVRRSCKESFGHLLPTVIATAADPRSAHAPTHTAKHATQRQTQTSQITHTNHKVHFAHAHRTSHTSHTHTHTASHSREIQNTE